MIYTIFTENLINSVGDFTAKLSKHYVSVKEAGGKWHLFRYLPPFVLIRISTVRCGSNRIKIQFCHSRAAFPPENPFIGASFEFSFDFAV